jgi:hypothetical protein
MQLRKMTLMLTMLGAMSMVLTGCPDGGRTTLVCEQDGDCNDGEVCHPTAKVCAQTCTIGADCPESTRRCEEVAGAGTPKVCKCDATANCAADERVDAELVCNTTAGVNLCVISCTADTDCGTGQTCDTATGFCKGSGTGGGTGTACDPATQPGICGYGQVCAPATSKCEAASQGTCSQATGAPAWNTSTSSAPVIVSVTTQSLATTNNMTQCGDGGPAGLVTIRFYAPGGLTTHDAFTDLQRHVRAKLNESGSFLPPSFVTVSPVKDASQGTMTVGFCGPRTASGAIYIANETPLTSNVVCTSW